MMNFRWAISFSLVLNLASAAPAQQPQNRIDLSAGEVSPLPQGAGSPPAVAGIAFRPVDAVCPREHGAIEIRSGQMYLSRMDGQNQVGSRFKGPTRLRVNSPLDDTTYQYEIGNEQCRLVLHVRLQTQRDGEWQPVLLPYGSRPTHSNEERSRRARELKGLFEERPRGQTAPPSRLPPPGPLLLGDADGAGEAFFFEGPSEAALAECFQAVGTYEVSQEGVFFTFLRALPGNLNRFAIERNDVNSHRGRMNFLRDGCRLEMTFSGSWKSQIGWGPMTVDRPM